MEDTPVEERQEEGAGTWHPQTLRGNDSRKHRDKERAGTARQARTIERQRRRQRQR